jgi:hypothetical protein
MPSVPMPILDQVDEVAPPLATPGGGELAARSIRDRLRPLLAFPLFTPLVAALRARKAASGLPGTLDEIAVYHRQRSLGSMAPPISTGTWEDLGMDAVFRRIDHCTSTVGQQVLYALLHSPESAPDRIAERDSLIRHLSTERGLRRTIERATSGLRHRGAYDLPYLFLGGLPRRPRFYFLFPALTVAALGAIVLSFVHPAAFIALLVVAFINICVQAYYRPRVQHLIAPIGSLRALLFAGRRLGSLAEPALLPYTDGLRARCERFRWIDRFVRYLVRESQSNELAEMAVGYANLLFLLDVNAFVFSIELIRRHREDLRKIFEAVGFVDGMCSVASFRQELPYWCTPELTGTRKEIAAEGLYHPLLTDPVANDLHVRGKGLLTTGSNMAGKTTYLRAVGLCALLAQTIATCPARSWCAPPLGIASLIDRKDDLLLGKSYFQVEAESVRELLTLAEGERQYLFIIDEIFRGTNTRERVAASKAVLEHLNHGDHISLVSTHDLELLELLGSNWEFWHFRETIDDRGASFDYRIRPGASSAPNALRLLAASGYPADLIEDAFSTYESLGQNG